MDLNTLLKYNWVVDDVINTSDSTFFSALNTAFLHFAAPDITVLGKDNFFPPIIFSHNTLVDSVESIEEIPKPIDGRASHFDSYIWTELHSKMSASGVSKTLLQYLLSSLRKKDIPDNALCHIMTASYVCSSVLLYEGLVLGRLYYIVNEYLDGKAFLTLVNALELSLVTCKNHLHILDPCLSLLTHLLPYIPYCVSKEYSSRVLDLLRPRLRSGRQFQPADPSISGTYFIIHELVDPNKQFKSNQLINLCLNIIVDARKESLITSIPEGTIPSQNVKVRMLLMSCQFLLSIICIFEGAQQLACIDYIESVLSFRLLKDYNSPHRGTVLISLMFDLLKSITDTGHMSVGVRLFICEFIFAIVVCSYYHYLPCIHASFYVNDSAKYEKMKYFKELMTNKSQKGASFSFQTLNECVNMMFHGIVLGNILHRYNTGTLLLYNTLLVPICSLSYFWVKSYHSLTEIYSKITIDLFSDNNTFCNPKYSIKKLTFEDSGKTMLYIDKDAIAGRIKYGENGKLEQYPFIYEVSLPERTLQAIYVAKACYLCKQPQEGTDTYTKGDNATRIFSIQLAEAEFNTYMLKESYNTYVKDPSTLAFYISWTHPCVSLHLDATQYTNECLLDLYYHRFNTTSPTFNALALGRYNELKIPYHSYTCYGYAAISDKDPIYIKDTMASIYETLTTVYKTPVHLRLSIPDDTDQRTSIRIDSYSAELSSTSYQIVFTEPSLKVGSHLIPRKQLFTEKTLRPSQFKALVYAVLSPLLLILGCPGSGKSTSLSLISKLLLLADGADSRWIKTSLNTEARGTEVLEWRTFSTVYANSIRTYTSCLDMLTDTHIGTQLFLMAHSNNAADQLVKYILTSDNWAMYTIPFTVRIGERSSEPFVRNFMPLQYLVNIAIELGINNINFSLLQDDISAYPSRAFSMLSKKIVHYCEANKDLLPISKEKYNLLKFILSDYMIYINWLMNHATIVVGTINGISSRIQFLQKQSDNFDGDPSDVRARGYEMIQSIMAGTEHKNPRKKANCKENDRELAMRMINYRCQKKSARHIIIEEAARLAEHEMALLLLVTFDKLILIGDVLQLPPLIQDRKLAATAALDWSLFHRLCYSSREGIPIIALEEQARSVPEIANLYRSLYESQLPKSCCIKGGLKDIPHVTFKTYIDSVVLSEFGGRCFFCPPKTLDNISVQENQISSLLKSINERVVQSSSNALLQLYEQKLQSNISNERSGCVSKQEKNAIIILFLRIVYKIIYNCTLFPDQNLLVYDPHTKNYEISVSIALLSLYNAQKQYIFSDPTISIIQTLCNDYTFSMENNACLKLHLDLNIDTTDGYQGLEADVVFLSVVGSKGNEFRNNLCRSLVAVSRARRLFVCVGAVDQYDNEIWKNVANMPPCPDIKITHQ